MSMDENPRAPRSSEVITGDALTSLSASIDAHAHAVKNSADTQTGPSEAVSDQGTVSFKGRSHPVSSDEAERLLAWLDELETSGWSSNADARAAGCLRRVAGCVLPALALALRSRGGTRVSTCACASCFHLSSQHLLFDI